MLRDLIRGALETVQTIAGEQATYTRGMQSVTVTALPGQAGFNGDPNRGLTVASDDQDWLVSVDQLVLGGVATFPKRGDRISVVRNGKTCLYEVLPNGDQPYRLDGTGTLCRIHTKLKSRT